jgi:ribose transport system permease protein
MPHRTRRRRAIDLSLEYGLYVALIAEIVIFASLSPFFLTLHNLLNIGQAVAVLGITAAGLTVCIIGGLIDLSQASVIALTTVVIAILHGSTGDGLPVWLALLAALGIALVIGVVNGVVCVKFGVNSIITTLGTSTALGGVALLIANAQTRTIVSADFDAFFFKRVVGIPITLIVMVAVYVVAAVLLYGTKLGWHIYAVGGNPSASTRAGIYTKRIYWFLLLQSAALGCLAGIITAGQSGAGAANLGGDLLDVLTAVLLGGLGLAGGGGRIERTLAGVLFIGVLNNGLILLNVPAFYGQVIRGVALILAVVMVSVRDRRVLL